MGYGDTQTIAAQVVGRRGRRGVRTERALVAVSNGLGAYAFTQTMCMTGYNEATVDHKRNVANRNNEWQPFDLNGLCSQGKHAEHVFRIWRQAPSLLDSWPLASRPVAVMYQ